MNSSETMKTITVDTPINLKVVRFELDFSSLLKKPEQEKKIKKVKVPKITINDKKKFLIPLPPLVKNDQKRDTKDLVEELLDELYADQRDWNSHNGTDYTRASTSIPSLASSHSNYGETEAIERNYLESLDIDELRDQAFEGALKLQRAGERLVKCVRSRDRLRRQQKKLCGAFSVLLRHISGVSGARFSVTPSGGEGPGEGGYTEWHQAMRLVARLPAGVPHHFRRKLWLTLAERHLTARGVDWPSAERACFRGTAQPDDTELGAQIIKDLHRTGCSLFCGAEGRENQAMLRRVLLAYARWNKEVGYCQGFNMLAAIILEVMDKSESDSLKVMIYLVEAVLPEGYFADDLRGLSADMAAFRDLLRIRLPRLAHHMDYLQKISDGGGVEPPLPDVFTMQWFLTLYATWLPRDCLLRIWDLVLLDGNEVLLLTALAIWDLLQDRILSARSADEFYSCMGGGAGVIWEAGEALVARVVAFGSAPELPRLRNLHRYRVAPPAPPTSAPVYQPPMHSAMQSMTKRGLRLFYSEDEGDSSDDGNKMALATVMPRRESRSGAGDRLSLDIGALKRQYARLRERQRQAHVILAAACARHAAVGVPTSPTSLTVNNLLLGKSAIVSSRGRRLGPPPGAVPPSRQSRSHEKTESGSRVRSTDTISWHEEKSKKSLSRRNSVKWKDIKKDKSKKVRKSSIDLEETGDGTIVSEIEANEMIASLRSRSSSETSSYSSRTNSSTDTSLCDENERGSDSEPDIPDDDTENKNVSVRKSKLPVSPGIKDTKAAHQSIFKETVIFNSSSFNKPIDTKQNNVKDITDYLTSAAGEPLRTYIDEFESQLKNNVTIDDLTECFKYNDNIYKPKSDIDLKDALISISSPSSVSKLDILASPSNIMYSYYDNDLLMSHRSSSAETARIPTTPRVTQTETSIITQETSITSPSKDFVRTTNIPTLPISPNIISPAHVTKELGIFERLNFSNKTDNEYIQSGNIKRTSIYLSPVDVTPSNYDFLSNLKSPINRTHLSKTQPPDIIDSFTMYANFVPDIDLSDNNSPDIKSSPQSPDEESIIVSEDEPPIPLKIDKYFEHSPEFFGARVTDPNNADIPSRRSTRRISRIPKKPDSLTLQSSHSDKILKEVERASSLPQSYSFTKKLLSEDESENEVFKSTKQKTPTSSSPNDFIIQSGRKNSERALQIIQENSKILSRILTKQNIPETTTTNAIKAEVLTEKSKYFGRPIAEKVSESKLIESPLLKESTSDSLIGCRKRNVSKEGIEGHDFVRIRPYSIDDPFSLEARNILPITEDLSKNIKSPSIDCLGNKTDSYGWENKGFLAKCDSSPFIEKPKKSFDFDYKRKTIHVPSHEEHTSDVKPSMASNWSRHSFSGESKTSVTLPSTEPKDTSTYGRRFTTDDCNYPLSNKYNDYVLSEASDICRKTVNQLPKVCDNSLKTEDSQASDFAHAVTSSISFTYEPSIDDDSPTGAISNSSDTLCQITSLDQVSTPISPKMFSVRDTPTLPKDNIEKSDTVKLESDDTCSAITSLLETDTLSSLSYPRSPSTGSYHPFPTRPLRMPKELGVKLGMYPKDNINSAPK